MTRTLEDARAEFEPTGVYLNTATMGLPPRRTIQAGLDALHAWQHGTSTADGFDVAVERSRRAFAALVGVDVGHVAIGPQVSVFTGLIASGLPADAEVLVPTGEFTSVTFPFWARGLRVREAPLAQLAEHVSADTTLVAAALVQSADGRLLDLDAVVTAAHRVGARVLLDVTQAAGWLPVDAGRADYTVCGGYKFLLGPRGTAFLSMRGDHIDAFTPVFAGWYAGEDPWDSIYGSPLRLATSARRFDVSPAWHAWVGQAESLDLLLEVGTDAIHRHVTGLAGRAAEALGVPDPGSAILSLAVTGETGPALVKAGIAASQRAGRLRLSFHLYNSDDDVDRVVDVLRSARTP
ncbi:aminotransferase class V-fold PLP-dependent enzyme [Nocardioides limicola]|uniref:aminotransferase class V-fold PLP-dependent enzyme n=1 Tax=Nocardioides limicola TaxID=2803368 RepID=UPI0027DE1FD9|nr:aminotransferase class V-fold PLP-dependent enzyme [Nocardioides sp. DJM-14]